MRLKLLSISAASTLLANTTFAAPPEIIELAKVNVELFEELVECAAHPDFQVYGLARSGPCGDWVDRIEAQQQLDPQLAGQGLVSCLAGDIRVAGNSLVSGNAEHFEFVSELVEECREAL